MAVRPFGPVIRGSIRRRCLVIPVRDSPAHRVILGSDPNLGPTHRGSPATGPPSRPVTGRAPPTRAHLNRPPRTAPPVRPCRRVSRPIALSRRRPDSAPDRTHPNRPPADQGRADQGRPPVVATIAPRNRNARRTANGPGRSRTHVNSHPARLTARANSRSSNVPAACRRSAPASAVLPTRRPGAKESHRAHRRTAPTAGPRPHRNAGGLVPPSARANSRSNSAPDRTGFPRAGPPRTLRASSPSNSAPARPPDRTDSPRAASARTPPASSPSNDRTHRAVGSPAPFHGRIGPVDADRVPRSRGARCRRVRVFPGCLPRIPLGTVAGQVDSASASRLRVRLLTIGHRSGPRSSPGRRR